MYIHRRERVTLPWVAVLSFLIGLCGVGIAASFTYTTNEIKEVKTEREVLREDIRRMEDRILKRLDRIESKMMENRTAHKNYWKKQ